MKIKSKILAAGLTVIMLAGSAFATGSGSDPDGLKAGAGIEPIGVQLGSTWDPNGAERGHSLDPEGVDRGLALDPDGLQGQIMTLLRLLIG